MPRGARLVSPDDSPQAARLHGTVDRLCALADMPKPRVAIAPAQMPNAFATGRSSKVAVVCATQGLLDRLDPEEPSRACSPMRCPTWRTRTSRS